MNLTDFHIHLLRMAKPKHWLRNPAKEVAFREKHGWIDFEIDKMALGVDKNLAPENRKAWLLDNLKRNFSHITELTQWGLLMVDPSDDAWLKLTPLGRKQLKAAGF